MRHSILNRLLGEPGPGGSGPGDADPAQIVEAIRRDVEDLLNTRNSHGEDLAVAYPEAAASVLGYGMPDSEEVGLSSRQDIERLRNRIQRVIETFEPRLRNVRVIVVEAPRPLTQEVVLEIQAGIRVRDAQERVVWNSTLRAGRIQLRQG